MAGWCGGYGAGYVKGACGGWTKGSGCSMPLSDPRADVRRRPRKNHHSSADPIARKAIEPTTDPAMTPASLLLPAAAAVFVGCAELVDDDLDVDEAPAEELVGSWTSSESVQLSDRGTDRRGRTIKDGEHKAIDSDLGGVPVSVVFRVLEDDLVRGWRIPFARVQNGLQMVSRLPSFAARRRTGGLCPSSVAL